jgi:hypothetical protein
MDFTLPLGRPARPAPVELVVGFTVGRRSTAFESSSVASCYGFFLPKPSYDISPNLKVRFPITTGKFHFGLKNVLTDRGLRFTVFLRKIFEVRYPIPLPPPF